MLARETDKSQIVDALELRFAAGCSVAPDTYAMLRHSAYARTLRIFLDELNRPVGYVSWASVNRASLDRLLRIGQPPKYPYEWSEGGICLILDVLILRRARYDAVRQLRKFTRTKRVIVALRKGKTARLYLRTQRGFVKRNLTGQRVEVRCTASAASRHGTV